jgi:hypothetical protein
MMLLGIFFSRETYRRRKVSKSLNHGLERKGKKVCFSDKKKLAFMVAVF